MRADRLLTIMLLLQKNKGMTAQDLARELEVSQRTIYRDIDALCIAGIPIYTQSGANGGIFIEESYRSSIATLSKNQVLSLFTLTDIGPLADVGLDRALKDSLLSLFNNLPESQQNEVERMNQRLYIDPIGWFGAHNTSDYLTTLLEVVRQDKQVRMQYQAYGREAYYLTVDAYALVSKADKWYLIGRKETGGYRTYRLSHIQNLQILDTTFERSSTFDLITYWRDAQRNFHAQMAEDFPRYTVTLHVHAHILWYFDSILDGQFDSINAIAEKDWFEVTVQFSSEYQSYSHLLAMGTFVRIIEPEALRSTMKTIAERIVAHYS
ncbi:MAG: YafY family protein [Phototrophicaceae bacterium]